MPAVCCAKRKLWHAVSEPALIGASCIEDDHISSEGLRRSTVMELSCRVTPEQRRALQRFVVTVFKVPCIQRAALDHFDILPTGFVALSFEPITSRHIPRGATWRWSQARSTLVCDIGGMQVCLKKQYPRPRRTQEIRIAPSHLPRFKAWLLTARSTRTLDAYFLWMERGAEHPLSPSNGNERIVYPVRQSRTTQNMALSR